MKRMIIIAVMIITAITITKGQCNSLFSYTVSLNKVTFNNQSNISNAHYFWDFGDGTGSNSVNPIHTFPDNGSYLITLFAEDTLKKCSSYYENQISVIKDSNDGCPLSISDSIYTIQDSVYLNIYNSTPNCQKDRLVATFDGGNFQNIAMNRMPVKLGYWQNIPFEIVCKGEYYNRLGEPVGNAYKTLPYQYSNSHNYGECSANFEFTVISKDSLGERILFTAMNKTAKSYHWSIYGFGNPINSTNDTISQFYPFTGNLYVTGLSIQGSNGCYDTVYRNITASNSVNTILNVNNLKINNETINVYPNPSNGILTFIASNEVSLYRPIIVVYNMFGERVSQFNMASNSIDVNLSAEPQGIYFYRIISQTGSFIGGGKLVIEK